MKLMNVSSNKHEVRKLLQGLLAQERVAEAHVLLGMLRQVGLPVDVVMYNLLMTAYKKKRFYDSVNQEKPSGSGGAVISGSTSGSRSTASSSRAGSTAPTIWVPREGVLKSGILAEARRRQRPIRAKEGTASGSSSTASSSGAGSTDIDPMVLRSSGAGGDTAGAEGTADAANTTF